jgi:transposase
MGKKADLTPQKRSSIVTLLQNSDFSQREIAHRLNVSQAVVASVKKKLDLYGTTSPRRSGRCGPRRKTSPQTDRWLVRRCLQNRKLTSKSLQLDLQERGVVVDASTVRRRLSVAGIHAYRPQKKPLLTVRMRRQRLDWAKQFKDWTSEDWSRVSK